MRTNRKFFKRSKFLPIDKFFSNVLYDKKLGYYSSKIPFGREGDYITAPNISRLYSEIIAIWIISTWEIFGKPKSFNIVELGPGDGGLMRVILEVSKKFPEFNKSKKIYLYEKNKNLIKKQKNILNGNKIKWIQNFKRIKKGPIIFFGNEFFDAIPIKQFKKVKKNVSEKYYSLKKDFSVQEVFRNATPNDMKLVNSFKTLKKLKFIEFPKLGFKILKEIVSRVLSSNGCILLVDYGYENSRNQNTLQSVIKHKRNNLFDNLGKADITSQVNFSLLSEFFKKNNLKVKKTITQREFLKSMGIMERASIIAKKMKFSEQSNLYFRLRRLLNPKSMGTLFKVILAYKNDNSDKYYGFK